MNKIVKNWLKNCPVFGQIRIFRFFRFPGSQEIGEIQRGHNTYKTHIPHMLAQVERVQYASRTAVCGDQFARARLDQPVSDHPIGQEVGPVCRVQVSLQVHAARACIACVIRHRQLFGNVLKKCRI